MADAIISASGMRLVRLLVGNPPQTISELVDALAVTRTAVTEQLNELVRSGFAERHTEHLATRGRPQYRYRATNAASFILYAQNQCHVVPSIWQAIEEVGGEELLRKVSKKVSRTLSEHYLRRVTAKKPDERLRQLMRLLNEEGGLTEVCVEDGRLTLNKRSCPFLRMADTKRAICCVDLEMMSQVIGRPVARTACRLDGDPCCKFVVAD